MPSYVLIAGILFLLNILLLFLGHVYSRRKPRSRDRFDVEILLRKTKHIFLNNVLAYLPLIVPYFGAGASLYIHFIVGRDANLPHFKRIIRSPHTYMESLAAALIASSGIALLECSWQPLIVQLLVALALLALSAYIEAKEIEFKISS